MIVLLVKEKMFYIKLIKLNYNTVNFILIYARRIKWHVLQPSEQAVNSNCKYLLVFQNEIQAIELAMEDLISILNTLN